MPPMPQLPCPVLEIAELTIARNDGRGRPLVDRASLRLSAGDVLGLVGESGSGKSTLALAMMGAVKPGLTVCNGEVRVGGVDLVRALPNELTDIRRRHIGYVPQNAGLALTPTKTINSLIKEVLRFRPDGTAPDLDRRAESLLDALNLDGRAISRRYPHQLSGGQQQRCAIAIALAARPKLLILDEPTAGIDASAQEAVIEILKGLAAEKGIAVLCITHDIRVAASLCSRLAVMYAGRIVEEGLCASLLGHPRHPYTRALVGSVPTGDHRRFPIVTDGYAPSTREAISGCAFAPRCSSATELCHRREPTRAGFLDGSLLCHHPWDGHGDLWIAVPEMAAPGPEAEAIPSLQVSGVSVEIHSSRWEQARGRPLRRVLDKVDIAVERGRILGIVGESGSGKTTLLKVMAGAISPSSGNVLIDGRDCRRRSLELRRRVQLIWQNAAAALNPRQTVFHAIRAPLRLYYGMSREEARAPAARLLEFVRLSPDYLERLPNQLSGGEAQRVAIARACAANPDILLCDEITSALDVSVQATVLTLLDNIRRETGCAIVFVSHDTAVIRVIADQIVVLKDGRVCGFGCADDVFDSSAHRYAQALGRCPASMSWVGGIDPTAEPVSAS